MKPPHAQSSAIAWNWNRFRNMLVTPVDGTSLAFFRIAFGLVMFWHAIKHFIPQGGTNLIKFHFVDVPFNFTYPGFHWVQPLPEPWIYGHFGLIALAGILVAAGLFYRASAVALFVSFTYYFLLDICRYNNHYYLMSLIAFLLIWMPAQRRFSIDAWWRSRRNRRQSWVGQAVPDVPPDEGHAQNDSSTPNVVRHSLTYAKTIPFWPIFLLRFQLFVMYFYGGIAKINADWLTGEPLSGPASQLHAFFDSMVGLPAFITAYHVALFLAWGGLFYDLSIGFMLLFRRTRLLAIALTGLFHLHNHFIFPIGVFPTLAFAATLIFFEPDWPLRFVRWLRKPRFAKPDWKWFGIGAFAVPVVGAVLGWKGKKGESTSAAPSPTGLRRLLVGFVCVWVATQLLFPFRHYLIEGDANWTEEGQDFAWRMMLRAKAAGHVTYHIYDKELQGTDARGRPQIDWSRAPAGTPRGTYVPIECRLFNWRHHPGMTITYEPVLGHRIIYYPSQATDESLAKHKDRIRQHWSKTYGREPQIFESVSLLAALDGLRDDVQQMRDQPGGDPSLELKLADIDMIREIAEMAPNLEGQPRAKSFIRLVDMLTIVARSEMGDLARKRLVRMHPFQLQGASFPGERFLIVYDPKATSDEEELLKLTRGEPYLVWIDLARLRPQSWRNLPLWFVTVEGKHLSIIWNHFKELNHIQLDRFTVRPYALRQYAQRIASIWEARSGRRPEVKTNSFIMLNYREPQSLIDPTIDLASTEYTVWGHNKWILPHMGQRLSKLQPPTHVAEQPDRERR